MKTHSGRHLSIVRGFIQWTAFNGSEVTWGSNDVLKLKQLTVKDLEQLAEDIRQGVRKEVLEEVKRGIVLKINEIEQQ